MLIVLVGVRGAGKTTLLSELPKSITVLQPTTTRAPRTEAEVEYEFVSHWDMNRYAWHIKIDADTYGMRLSEVAKAHYNICITVFDPLNISSLHEFRKQSDIEIVTVGLNTVRDQDEQVRRTGGEPTRRMSYQDFQKAVAAVVECDLVISGTPDVLAGAIASLISLLSHRGGRLVKEDIRAFMNASALIEGGVPAGVRSASYDLRLGHQVWCQGRLHELTPSESRFDIPPYSYAIVAAKETAVLPTFITGTFDLKVSMFLHGVLLSNGPQIDPGYRGQLFCMLFNGSSQKRPLIYNDHFATIEFSTTSRPTEPYKQQYQLQERLETIMGEGAMGSVGGDIIGRIDKLEEDLRGEIKDIKTNTRNTLIGVAGIAFAAIAIPGGIFLTMLWDRVKAAEEVVGKIKEGQKQVEETSRAATDRQKEAKSEIDRAVQEGIDRLRRDFEELRRQNNRN